MLRRAGHIAVVIALVVLIGGHWAFLQGVAWVGMAISFSQTDCLSTAITKTFDGNHPCKLCKFVKEGKKTESKSAAQLDVKKPDFFTDRTAEFSFPPNPQPVFGSVSLLLPRTTAPPTPPPLRA